MFITVAIVQALLAASAFALPSAKERFEKRAALRGDSMGPHRHPRQSLPFQHVQGSYTNKANVDYSSNWAGVVLASEAGTWSYVAGTFKVPTPTEPQYAFGPHAASAWVGIDGYTCPSAILQTGLDFIVNEGSDIVYIAWYEWYPDVSHDFANITFKAGDVVNIYVNTTSPATGVAVIENLTQNTTVTQDMSGPALCLQDAEWIVEDFQAGDTPVPFADFDVVAFDNATAITAYGTAVGPDGDDAVTVEIYLDGKVVTQVNSTATSVIVTYV